ncbi:MAG: lytic transglycosylase domain-containing protein [Clostridia bacterium]|nr:lytic transglycosylase domain-containing protein [Clostridia bacterium]MBR4443837.1 lytic transglycosylase domain-containing protein [Clostridia bacterium]
MIPNAVPRSRRRTFRKRKLAGRIAAIVIAAALLVALGVYYIARYRQRLIYAQYPLSYKSEIVEMADEFGLEPWHIAAVIRCESSFNARATSSVGARGLMQIMPETGEWLAGKFGEADDFDPESLYDPETNMKYGCWFLNWLMNRFHRDIVLVTAAYHAGQGTVDKWLADSAVSPDGQTIAPADIPYASTAAYVTRVLKAYEKYEELYDYET